MSEELDLRACLEVLYRGRWLVILVTVAAVAASGLVSFFVLEPAYQAEALVGVTPAQVAATVESDGLSSRLRTLSEPSRLTPQAFAEQVTTDPVLDRVRGTLGLDVTRRQLRQAITAKVVEETELVRLTAEWHDARVAAEIVNELLTAASERVNDLESERLERLAQLLQEEARRQRDAARTALHDLRAFFASGPAAGELSSEVTVKESLLAEYRRRLAGLDVEIGALETQVAAAGAELAALPPLLTTGHSLLEDAADTGTGMAAGASADDLASLRLEGEQINPAWAA